MTCPYCLQGNVYSANVKKTGKKIFICEECDTVWSGSVCDETATNLEDYMETLGLKPVWDELDSIEPYNP